MLIPRKIQAGFATALAFRLITDGRVGERATERGNLSRGGARPARSQCARRDVAAGLKTETGAFSRASNVELEQFNRAMVGREMRMIELKQEVNELLDRAGQPPRYPSAVPGNFNGMPGGSPPLKETKQ